MYLGLRHVREVSLVSKLYKVRAAYPLTYTPVVAALSVFNPETGRYDEPAPTGEPVTFEVQLEKSSQQSTPERPGLEAGTTRINGRVVKTPDESPLEFPASVKAGDTFDVTLFGAKGKLELLPTSDSQVPKVRQKLGQSFEAVFFTSG